LILNTCRKPELLPVVYGYECRTWRGKSSVKQRRVFWIFRARSFYTLGFRERSHTLLRHRVNILIADCPWQWIYFNLILKSKIKPQNEMKHRVVWKGRGSYFAQDWNHLRSWKKQYRDLCRLFYKHSFMEE